MDTSEDRAVVYVNYRSAISTMISTVVIDLPSLDYIIRHCYFLFCCVILYPCHAWYIFPHSINHIQRSE